MTPTPPPARQLSVGLTTVSRSRAAAAQIITWDETMCRACNELAPYSFSPMQLIQGTRCNQSAMIEDRVDLNCLINPAWHNHNSFNFAPCTRSRERALEH
jgi:hypothetical protein